MQKEVACSEKGIYVSAKKEATVSLELFFGKISLLVKFFIHVITITISFSFSVDISASFTLLIPVHILWTFFQQLLYIFFLFSDEPLS